METAQKWENKREEGDERRKAETATKYTFGIECGGYERLDAGNSRIRKREPGSREIARWVGYARMDKEAGAMVAFEPKVG